MKSHFKLTAGILLALHAILGAIFAFYRFVDWDEGFYLMAGERIHFGLRLYTDFFHPQAPAYAHMLSNLAQGGWEMLLQARFINVALSVVTGFLVAFCALQLFRTSFFRPSGDNSASEKSVFIGALAIYCLSGLFLSWNTPAKPLALSQFLLVAALFFRLLVHTEKPVRSIFWLLLCGIALAGAAQTRSPLLIVIPLMLIHLLLTPGIPIRLLGILGFITGVHVCFVPTIIMAQRDSTLFFFDNFVFHMRRTPEWEVSTALADKLITLGKLLIDPQVLIVLALIIVATALESKRRKWIHWLSHPAYFALLSGVAIFALYMLAEPVHRQYITQSLPLFMAFGAIAIPSVISKLSAKQLATASALYILPLIAYFVVFIGTVREYDAKGAHDRLETVTTYLQENSLPQDYIYSESPIYPLLAQRNPVPLTEFIGVEYTSLQPASGFTRYNLSDKDLLLSRIDKRMPAIVICDFRPDSALADALSQSYQLDYEDFYCTIFKRKPESADSASGL